MSNTGERLVGALTGNPTRVGCNWSGTGKNTTCIAYERDPVPPSTHLSVGNLLTITSAQTRWTPRGENKEWGVCNRDVLLVVKGVLYLVDLWSVETVLEYDESDVPKDTR